MTVRRKRTRKKIGPNAWINVSNGRQTSVTTKHGGVTYTTSTTGPTRRTVTTGDFVEKITLDYRSEARKKRDADAKRTEAANKRKAKAALVNALTGRRSNAATVGKVRTVTGAQVAMPRPGVANWLGKILVRLIFGSLRKH